MIPLLTADEMRALEGAAIQEWGIPALVLQEHAAMGALALIPQGQPIQVLAGPGNNGGDALALARLAKLRGERVEVWTLDSEPRWRGDAALQARLWEGLGGGYRFTEDPQVQSQGLDGWFVDGLFGLGTRLPLPPLALAWIEALSTSSSNSRPRRVLSLDLPSGLDPGSGDLRGPAFQAEATACFGHLKRCHGMRPARDRCGTLQVIPLPLPGAPAPGLFLLEGPGLPAPGAWNTHKRDLGHVAIRAGCSGMGGAAVLAAMGALRMGAGLVTVLTDPAVRSEVASQVPEAMVRAWEGRIPEDADVLLVGPGGVTEIPAWEGPLVLDASALGAGEGPRWMQRPWTVLTPHPGEFARLFEMPGSLGRDCSPRLEAMGQVADAPGILVLKGAQSLVGGGGSSTLFVNPTGHPGLSTGGTGDFLAGMVAARTAAVWKSGGDSGKLKEAVAGAVWLHGAAADRLGPGPLLVRELGPILSELIREQHGDG